ncbi:MULTISPECIES: phosphatase PAP2 family protein [Rhodanobacteraceae]|jgi:undecaprenyl-diphosphatase|uniref:Undecaprenyl-diphosphatase n=1 Tax=Rhodanobacter glycinis TaxID=582702 RepID=A0A1I3YC70_9GAMM|nr:MULTISPECIES: phosphatase PAP2 family protein [Rhodanobacter]HEU0198755.1 phosphatase PAP2 family protein [Nevskiaceae bacterium]EIL87748.1 UDP-diphosphatase [Rhodanobacter sp. 115]KZC19655.1 UDP-diphosphatase [Rhodanobacter denitrificans]UJJ53489.1 phosphatase PAP2 family protein [Rhodanobacter thiooxydans]UJJ56818.1 phosphatase PAP2 family protein [Rhodanobacter thiooxydans]
MTSPISGFGSMVYAVDLRLFNAIHSPVPPSPAMLHVARVLADGPLILTALLLGWMLMVPRQSMRLIALKASGAAAAALLANLIIGLVWDRARPFVAGVGQAWVSHAATGSFPSDHLTVQWVVAGILLLNQCSRPWGIGIALLGLPMAWARIYLGVHYPGDMLGALGMGGLAMLSGWLWFRRSVTSAIAPLPSQG